MTQHSSDTALAPVVCEVTVPATRHRAFELYVRNYSSWAVKDHYLGAAPPTEIVIEPRVGGRWYEVQPDGTECDWGRVLEMDDSSRIVLSWHIGATAEGWAYDPDPTHASRVEVTFEALAPARTLVRLTHSRFEAHGTGAVAIQQGVASPEGWTLDLAAFANSAGSDHQS